MAETFLKIAFTDSVLKAQEHYFGTPQQVNGAAERDALTEDEIDFIRARDSFYMATVIATQLPENKLTPRQRRTFVLVPSDDQYGNLDILVSRRLRGFCSFPTILLASIISLPASAVSGLTPFSI